MFKSQETKPISFPPPHLVAYIIPTPTACHTNNRQAKNPCPQHGLWACWGLCPLDPWGLYPSSQYVVYPSEQHIVYLSSQYIVYPSQQLIFIPVSYLFFISVSHTSFYISASIYYLAVLPALINFNSITTHLKTESIISLLYKPSTLIILTVTQPSPEVNIYIPSQYIPLPPSFSLLFIIIINNIYTNTQPNSLTLDAVLLA